MQGSVDRISHPENALRQSRAPADFINVKWPCTSAAVAIVGLRLAILPWLPVPEPRSHDEFAYLLGAETFLAGRLTNPVHPMWTHFETFHVNMVPTYQMKYPPAQSLSLAFGILFFGHPWAGVIATTAAMAAAICWMLLAWFEPRWAFGVTCAAMVQICLFSYWMNSYWGGTLASAGGALVIGAAVRILRDPRAATAAVAAVGISILGLSRPFEGAILTLVAGVTVLAGLYRQNRIRAVIPLVVPVAIIGIAVIGFLAYYNYRVTGHATVLPYQEYQRQYGASPLFLIQPDIPMPHYRHDSIRRFWEWDRKWYLWAVENPWFSTVSLLRSLAFYVPLPLTLGLIWGIRKRPLAGGLLAAFLAVLCLERWLVPHYLAPAAGMIVLLTAMGLREMDRRIAAGIIGVAAILQFLTWTPGIYSGYGAQFVAERRQVLRQLASSPGPHLVFVRYTEKHDGSDEWVYNSASIDQSPIVWAREMNPEDDAKLEAYYPGRRVWLLEADSQPARLTPFGRSRESANPRTSN